MSYRPPPTWGGNNRCGHTARQSTKLVVMEAVGNRRAVRQTLVGALWRFDLPQVLLIDIWSTSAQFLPAETTMRITGKAQIITVLLSVGLFGYAYAPAAAAVRIEGRVQAGGGPLAGSTVTLWTASAGEPKQLAQTKSGNDGRFELGAAETPDKDVILYLVAKGGEATINKGSGDNPAIAS